MGPFICPCFIQLKICVKSSHDLYNPTLRKLRQEDQKFRPAWGTYRIPVLNMYVMPGICQARPGVSLRPRAISKPKSFKGANAWKKRQTSKPCACEAEVRTGWSALEESQVRH